MVTATLKTAAADIVTQRYLEGSDSIDMRRVGVFTVFGFWYLGCFQYFLYVRCFSRWFPAAEAFGEHATMAARLKDAAGLRDLAKQVFVGNFVHIPFAFLPCFYLTQEVTTHGAAASPTHALSSYRANLWSDCMSAWAIWGAFVAQTAHRSVYYSLLPPARRAKPHAHVACALWLTRLSRARALPPWRSAGPRHLLLCAALAEAARQPRHELCV